MSARTARNAAIFVAEWLLAAWAFMLGVGAAGHWWPSVAAPLGFLPCLAVGWLPPLFVTVIERKGSGAR